MQTPSNPITTISTPTEITLHKLVNELVIGLIPQATRLKSFIINDIQREMLVNTDEDILATVLSSLLNNTVLYTENNCIHVSAESFGNITMMHVKDDNTNDVKAIADSLQQAAPLAKKLGGCLSITNNKLQGTTIAFTFLNGSKAA